MSIQQVTFNCEVITPMFLGGRCKIAFMPRTLTLQHNLLRRRMNATQVS